MNTDKTPMPYYFTLFIINPFISFLIVLRMAKHSIFVPIYTMFCGFYGFTFASQRESMDSYRHRQDFIRLANYDIYSLDDVSSTLYGDHYKGTDVLLQFLKFALSRLTSNPDILYLILGLLFGYVMALNIKHVFSYVGKHNKFMTIVFFGLLLTIIGVYEINSFRFWMGAHVFILGFITIISLKKVFLGFALILLTPFIHFSLLFIIFLFGMYFLIGNRYHLYFILFVCSFFISGISGSFIKSSIPDTGIEVFENKKQAYIKEDISEISIGIAAASSLNWYVKGRTYALKYLTLLLCTLFYFSMLNGQIRINKIELQLFSFALFITGICIILMTTVPQFGRFYRIGLWFFYSFALIIFSNGFRLSKILDPLIYGAAALYIVVEIRIAFDTFTVDTVLSNPVIAIFGKSGITLIDFVKGVL